eukprot:101122_1
MSSLTAVVTGASSGIGAATVKRLISLNWNVIMISRSTNKMEKVAKSCIQDDNERQKRIKIISFDLSKPELIENKLLPSIREYTNNGAIDLLVNNAGGGITPSDVKNCSLKNWNLVLNLNLTSPFLLIKCLRNDLIKSKYPSSIINIGSVSGNYPEIYNVNYSVAKRGLQMLNKSYALYYSKYKIRVNNIEPGYIDTPIQANRRTQKQYEESNKYMKSICPIGRNGETKDIVDAIMFLSDSNKSGFITGQNIVIDGGLTLPLVHTVRKSKM